MNNKKNFFERMKEAIQGPPKKPGYVFTTRNLARQTGNGELIEGANSGATPPSTHGTLMDSTGTAVSYAIVNDYIQPVQWQGGMTQGVGSFPAAKPEEKKADTRKAVEPKAVFEEIKKKSPEISFDNLDEKIIAVEKRIEVLKEHLSPEHLRDEQKTLFFLRNRRLYLKTGKKYPIDWAMTNREAVDDLCKRYKLKVVPLKQYYTLIPGEGIKEMDRYTNAYKAITCGDCPIFELIIKDVEAKTTEGQKQKKKDRDPILLANSPFADTMFVLGAWDDEVEIVDEIIYHGK